MKMLEMKRATINVKQQIPVWAIQPPIFEFDKKQGLDLVGISPKRLPYQIL